MRRYMTWHYQILLTGLRINWSLVELPAAHPMILRKHLLPAALAISLRRSLLLAAPPVVLAISPKKNPLLAALPAVLVTNKLDSKIFLILENRESSGFKRAGGFFLKK
mgnify:CR=1 FL=1